MRASTSMSQVTGPENGKKSPMPSSIPRQSKVWTTNTSDRFGWANGMFGQMILDIDKRFPHLLSEGYQQTPGLLNQALSP